MLPSHAKKKGASLFCRRKGAPTEFKNRMASPNWHNGGQISEAYIRENPTSLMSFTDPPDSYMTNPYGSIQRPILNSHHIQYDTAVNATSILPQHIAIPSEHIQIVSSQVKPFNTVFSAPQSMSIERKGSSVSSVRVKSLGRESLLESAHETPQYRIPDSMTISVGPTPIMPIVAASATRRDWAKEIRFLQERYLLEELS
jgi:hypothetical protein